MRCAVASEKVGGGVVSGRRSGRPPTAPAVKTTGINSNSNWTFIALNLPKQEDAKVQQSKQSTNDCLGFYVILNILYLAHVKLDASVAHG